MEELVNQTQELKEKVVKLNGQDLPIKFPTVSQFLDWQALLVNLSGNTYYELINQTSRLAQFNVDLIEMMALMLNQHTLEAKKLFSRTFGT